MFGLNPVATGILLGGITAGPMGMALGGGIGAMYDSAQGQQRDAEGARRDLQREGIKNQNAIVADQFNKRKSAFGIGEGAQKSPMGNAASQSGSVLTSTTSASSTILG